MQYFPVMIYHRKPGRTVSPLGVRNFRQDQHETASGSRLKLVCRRPGKHPFPGFFSSLRPDLQRAVSARQDFLQFRKLALHERAFPSWVGVVQGHLEEFSFHESRLQGRGLVAGQSALGGSDNQDLETRLRSRGLHGLIEAGSHSPLDQAGRGIAPAQSKRRL